MVELIPKKEIGNIKSIENININAITFKNGEEVIKFYGIPMKMSNYTPPINCPNYIKGETFSLWFNLANPNYKKIEQQLKKEIREMGIWLVEDEIKQLRDFLNKIEFPNDKKTNNLH